MLHQAQAFVVVGERLPFRGQPAEVVGVIEDHNVTLVTLRVDTGPVAGVLHCRCGLPGCPGTAGEGQPR